MSQVGLFSTMEKSAMMPGRSVLRRRASMPAASSGRCVQFRQATSIADVHYIAPDAPPQRHLSDEPGMQYMEANIKERKVRSLCHQRKGGNLCGMEEHLDPFLSKLRSLPTPTRVFVGRPGRTPLPSSLQRCLPSTPNQRYPVDVPGSPMSVVSEKSEDSAGSSLPSSRCLVAVDCQTHTPQSAPLSPSAFASTRKSGTVNSTRSAESGRIGQSSTAPLHETFQESRLGFSG